MQILNKFSSITIFIILLSLCIPQAKITIYNHGQGLIQEVRLAKLKNRGEQNFIIENLPRTVEPSSIILLSENIEFISTQFIKKPITNLEFLNASIGDYIELVKYGEEGNITYITTGKLISNTNLPVFIIDDKVVINPPYSYRFNEIPRGVSDYPYLTCIINSSVKKTDYHLSYITTGLDWEAEYNIFLNSDNSCEIEGWYSIRNDLNVKYDNATISLVSGEINYNKSNNYNPSNRRMKAAMSMSNDNLTYSEVSKINDYSIFSISNTIDLTPMSQLRHKFVKSHSIPYKNVYHISHSLQRNINKSIEKNQDIPVYIRLELQANDIGNFQLPRGSYNVYEKKHGNLTYIGGDTHSIIDGEKKIKLEIGKTQDILCTFKITEYEINRDVGEAEISAIFKNNKDNTIDLIWTEIFADGRWKIINSNTEYTQLDAYNAQFNIKIPNNSITEINFKARIEKY